MGLCEHYGYFDKESKMFCRPVRHIYVCMVVFKRKKNY